MSDPQNMTVGQHLDAVLSTLATKDDVMAAKSELRAEIRSTAEAVKTELRAEIRESAAENRALIIAAVNEAVNLLRVDLNKAGIKVGVAPRGQLSGE